MSETPIERLRSATRKREELRRTWDARRNLDLLALLRVTIPVMMKSERFGLFVRDPNSDALWVETGTGVTERSIVVTSVGSMLGEAIQERKPIIKEHLSDAHGAHQSVANQIGFVTKDALTVPIFSPDNGQAIGAIQVLNKQISGGWTEEDARLLQEVAHSISGSVAIVKKSSFFFFKCRFKSSQHMTASYGTFGFV